MKLYYAPGACSLASRIALHEAGVAAEFERVDLTTKITERGYDYLSVNPRGYVPLLALDDGNAITESIAVLEFIADGDPGLRPGGPLGRTRLIEILAWLSTELHTAFRALWRACRDEEKTPAAARVTTLLDIVSDQINELYLFGPRFTVADGYLFTMLRWAGASGVAISREMNAYFERVAERPLVRRALAEEGLPDARAWTDLCSVETGR